MDVSAISNETFLRAVHDPAILERVVMVLDTAGGGFNLPDCLCLRSRDCIFFNIPCIANPFATFLSF
jgi:hypothetical protein